ncbi:MAG: LysR family transcriptional regulator [Pseudomonadota bacterium]
MVQKRSSKLSWDGLETVLLIHRHGTIRAAADVAGVAHTTLAHRVARLEEALGQSVFAKSRKGYRLTEDGQRLISHVEDMARAADAVGRVYEGSLTEATGTVHVSLTASLATYAVAEVVATLGQSHPGIQLHLDVGDAIVDLDKLEADIALRIQRMPAPDLFGRRLAGVAGAIYAPEGSMEALNAKSSTLPLVGWGEEDRMRELLGELGITADVTVKAVTPDIDAQIAVARACGFALALPCFVGDQLGDFRRLPSQPVTEVSDLWILTNPSLRAVPRIAAVFSELSRFIGTKRPLFEGRAP